MYLLLLCLVISSISSLITTLSASPSKKVGDGIGAFIATGFVTGFLSLYFGLFIAAGNCNTFVRSEEFPLFANGNSNIYVTLVNGKTNFAFSSKGEIVAKTLDGVKLEKLESGKTPYVTLSEFDSSGNRWCYFDSTRIQYTVHANQDQIKASFSGE